MIDARSKILLRGTPDGILVRADGKAVIVDYKTAKYTGKQDALFPMYSVQLNVYALIADHMGLPPVAALALIYMEPATTADHCQGRCKDHGFEMLFQGRILPVELDCNIEPLLARTRRVFELLKPPLGLPECKTCTSIEAITGLIVS